MRKKFDQLIFTAARFGLVIIMAGCLVSAIAAIITVSFNLPGRIRLNKNTSISLSEFDRGIPFYATLATEIPDSSIASNRGGTISLHNYYPGDDAREQVSLNGVDYSDKIVSDFKVLNERSASNDIKLSGAKLNAAVFYLQPAKILDRLVLSLPGILTLLLIAFCSWQLLRIVNAIHSGNSFNQSSVKKIAGIGWAILVTFLLLFILDSLQNSVASVSLDFSSTIPNYRMPFQATAYKKSFSHWDWLIGGAIILLVAKAFRYGNQLQKQEDLTI